jgi:hypothetical protein
MDRSDAARIEDWFEGLPETWRPVAEGIRSIVMEASPLIREEWRYGTPFYSHLRWMCYLSLQKKGLVLGFVQGAAMADPEGLLAHTEHRLIRHFLPAMEVAKLSVGPLHRLIQKAVEINKEIHRTRPSGRGKRSQ